VHVPNLTLLLSLSQLNLRIANLLTFFQSMFPFAAFRLAVHQMTDVLIAVPHHAVERF
jgi:hypothetical protein